MNVLSLHNLSEIPHIQHAVFSRKGGCSEGPYQSLNLSLNSGDDEERVRKNRNKVSAYMNTTCLAFLKQVHGHTVWTVDREMLSRQTAELFVGAGDAMITNLPGVALMILVADCQAVLLADPVQKVIANVHVGWRGNVKEIIPRTIAAMVDGFGCNPADLRAGISPSLGPCCAEFVNYKSEIPRKYWHYKDSRHRFDLWAISRAQLLSKGLLPENVHTSGICTRCRTDAYYSYRASKVTGRFAALIQLNETHPKTGGK